MSSKEVLFEVGTSITTDPTFRVVRSETGQIETHYDCTYPLREPGSIGVTATTDASGNVTGLGAGGILLTDTYIGDASTPEQNATLINTQLTSRRFCEIGPGVHQIQTPILMPSNSAIVGRGRGISTIKIADGADCCAIQNSNVVAVNAQPAAGQENIHISDITIDGNIDGQTGASAALVDSAIDGLIHGIFLGWVKNTSIRNVEIHSVDGYGAFIRGWAQYTSSKVHHISKLYVHDNGLNGCQFSNAARLLDADQILAVSNGRDGIVIDASEMQCSNFKAVGNNKDGIYIRNVHNNVMNNFDAYNNGRNGIRAVAVNCSKGADWKAVWNGRNETGSDIWFEGTGYPTWGYGVTNQTVIDGIMAGPIKGTTGNITFSDALPIGTKTERWGVLIDAALTGYLRLLNVTCDVAGLDGTISAPTLASLLIHELPGATNNSKITQGSLMINGALSVGSSAPQGVLRLGSYRVWVDNTGLLRMKNSDPANSTDGTIVGTQG